MAGGNVDSERRTSKYFHETPSRRFHSIVAGVYLIRDLNHDSHGIDNKPLDDLYSVPVIALVFELSERISKSNSKNTWPLWLVLMSTFPKPKDRY
jgi:hypothetical protein